MAMRTTREINFRDPFVLSRPHSKYYMFGTDGPTCWDDRPRGFYVYSSTDLENWDGPTLAFAPPPGFWSDKNYWAPEVHHYRGRFYMFASFKADSVCRGTQILVSDQPEGPYAPISGGPATPRNWECLDGTLYVDNQEIPHMVFCHEWVQVGDGEICSIELSQDLSSPVADPKLLLRASEHPLSSPINTENSTGHVTDGPFLHTADSGSLYMLWSTMGEGQNYLQLVSRSESGTLDGPWDHREEPIYSGDGGHGMLFRTFDGTLMIALHTPNKTPGERPVFYPIVEQGGWVDIVR